MPKTILVTGSSGQLGQSLQRVAKHSSQYQFTFVTRAELDLSQPDSITHYFNQYQFDVIINCAAYTAVDKAESDTELAYQINHIAVKQLAEIALKQQSFLIHISTDYVFDGQNYQPYLETDRVNPQSVYGASKLKGEQAIQAIAPQAIIIRTSWVYSEFGHNFVKTMLKLGQTREQLGVIFDQIGSPTYAYDLAGAIVQLIEIQSDNQVRLYHYSNEGVCSWYDFAKAIFELSNVACQVNSITTQEYPTPAQRPHYSLLNKANIKQEANIVIPYWKDSLQHCLVQLQGQQL